VYAGVLNMAGKTFHRFTAMPTMGALRRVSSEARMGEQSTVA